MKTIMKKKALITMKIKTKRIMKIKKRKKSMILTTPIWMTMKRMELNRMQIDKLDLQRLSSKELKPIKRMKTRKKMKKALMRMLKLNN